jgi:hypothetical protein
LTPKLLQGILLQVFKYNSGIKKLFPTNMNQQYVHLPDMLSFIILNHDHHTGLVLPGIIKMSKRHIRHGLKLADSKVAGSALLSTFKKRLGKE